VSKKAEEIQRAWEYYRAANELLAARFNYSMVAHAMALTAYSAVIAGKPTPAVAAIVAGFGVFFSWVQWTITRGLAEKLRVLRGEYLVQDPVYLRYNSVGRRNPGTQTGVVPTVLALMWTILFGYAGLIGLKLITP